MGLNRNMRTVRARGTNANEGFGKFLSNAVPTGGRSHMETEFAQKVEFNQSNGFLRSSRSSQKAFIAGCQKGASIPATWKYEINGPQQKIPFKTVSGFYNRHTSEAFTNLNQIGYGIDPFERQQDILRKTQAEFDKKVLDPERPFRNIVR